MFMHFAFVYLACAGLTYFGFKLTAADRPCRAAVVERDFYQENHRAVTASCVGQCGYH